MNHPISFPVVYSSPDAFDDTLNTLIRCVQQEWYELKHALEDMTQKIQDAHDNAEQTNLLLMWQEYQAVYQAYANKLEYLLKEKPPLFLHVLPQALPEEVISLDLPQNVLTFKKEENDCAY